MKNAKNKTTTETPVSTKLRTAIAVTGILLTIAFAAYGILAHQITILVEEEKPAKPKARSAAQWLNWSPEDDKPKLIEKTISEITATRDVTVGGLIRLQNGTIKRTYSGKPPSTCPT